MHMKFGTVLYKTGVRFFTAMIAVGFLCTATPAFAVSNDENALIEGAKLCTRYLPRHERQYGIPEHLLAAIASTESGRFHRGLGLNLPWPWTINVNGRGYFFDTKEEAVAAVNKLKSQGYTSIDVGCMQVNLHHHAKAFASVEQAFDPAYNVGYAADFLKRNFMEEGSWRKATGDYHSRTPSYGSSYAEQVFGAWGRISAKVADARAGRPVLNTYAKNTSVKQDGKPVVMASRVVRHSYHSPHMRLITVSDRPKTSSRENGVLVIRPQKNDDLVVQTASSQDNALVSKPVNVQLTATKATPADMAVFNETPAPSKNAKLVNVATKAQSKGQFEPRKQTNSALNIVTTPATASMKAEPKMFVFDN